MSQTVLDSKTRGAPDTLVCGTGKRKLLPFGCITEERLAMMGVGEYGYVRKVSAEQVRADFPNLNRRLPKSGDVFVLRAADGTLISMSETAGSAFETAWKKGWYIQYFH